MPRGLNVQPFCGLIGNPSVSYRVRPRPQPIKEKSSSKIYRLLFNSVKFG